MHECMYEPYITYQAVVLNPFHYRFSAAAHYSSTHTATIHWRLYIAKWQNPNREAIAFPLQIQWLCNLRLYQYKL